MSKFDWSDDPLKDKADNDGEHLQRSFARRAMLLAGITLAGMAGLFGRLFYLQVERHEHYRTRSQSNRVRIKPLVPERGTIYDRHGRALTENILRHQVVVNPWQVQDLDALLVQLGTILPLSDEEISDFRHRYQRSRRYEFVVLKDSVNEAEHYQLAAMLYRFPGVAIEPTHERYYPYGSLLSHVLGYTNRINQKDLETLNPDDYHGLDSMGRAGIERQYEDALRGKPGFRQLEADVNGNLVRLLSEKSAVRGQDIYLTLDVDLQQRISEVMGDHRGACVVLDPNNGEVLAMVSRPSYDANLFVRGITQRQYDRLLNHEYSPLYHRAVKGRYAPGSVIKPMMAMAGLHYGLYSPQSRVNCSGYYRIPDSSTKRRFHCWQRSGHGSLDMEHAIAESCDIYFYSLGYKLGVDRIHDYAQHFSLGHKTGIDLPDESSGILPSRAWKLKQHGSQWYIGDTINISIGQGFLTTTPLQLAQMTAIIANDGIVYKPHLLRQYYDPQSASFRTPQTVPGQHIPVYDAAAWRAAKHAMSSVMNSRYGTARRVGQGLDFTMAGKSGTVQVISFQDNRRILAKDLADEHQDNAMFIAFAPLDKPKVAVSMVIERGGGGSSVAAPLVAQIIDSYLHGESHART